MATRPVQGTTDVIRATDNNGIVAYFSDSDVSVSVPAGLPSSMRTTLLQLGTGTVTVSEGAGVTLETLTGSFATGGQWGELTLTAYAVNSLIIAQNSVGGGGSLTVTDGDNTVDDVTSITFSGATVSGSTPDATVTVSGGSAPVGTSALIASAIGVDLNTVGDTVMTLSAFASGKYFVVDYPLVTNPSVSLDTAVANVWSGADGTGQSYGSFNNLALLVNPRDWIEAAGGATITGNGTMQNTPPIVNVSTPQGSAATADFYIYGRVFT
jgi:hypothetical protein